MTTQSISFEGFVPFGTKLREQTVPLGNAIPVGASILEQTADRLTIRVPECGGGVLLTGLRGRVGNADWNAARWLAMDVNYPQPEQFALCLCIGVYRYDQDPEREAPYFGVLTGTFPNYKTRISLGFDELACKNGFLPRTPGKLKTVCQMVTIVIVLLNNIPFELIYMPIDEILLWFTAFVSAAGCYSYFNQLKDYIFESM